MNGTKKGCPTHRDERLEKTRKERTWKRLYREPNAIAIQLIRRLVGFNLSCPDGTQAFIHLSSFTRKRNHLSHGDFKACLKIVFQGSSPAPCGLRLPASCFAFLPPFHCIDRSCRTWCKRWPEPRSTSKLW